MSLETEKGSSSGFTAKQTVNAIPVLDGSVPRLYPDFKYKLEGYAEGISAWHGEVVKLAFTNPASAKTKYPYDHVKAMELEDRDYPDDPESEDTPDSETESEKEEEDDKDAQGQRIVTKRPSTRKPSPKPHNWNTMKNEDKEKWKEKQAKKLKREKRRQSKKAHSIRVKIIHKEKKHYERMRVLQLVLSVAFSHPLVVQYLRTKTVKNPIDMIEHVRGKFGSVVGVHKHLLADRFDHTYPKPGQNVDGWINSYLALKTEVESQRSNPFEVDELTRKLLTRLAKHPAFGNSYRENYYSLPASLRPTHDDIIESARETWALWKRNDSYNTGRKKNEREKNDKGTRDSNLMLGDKGDVGGEGGKPFNKLKKQKEWWLKVTCFACEKVGHTKKYCPSNKKKADKPKKEKKKKEEKKKEKSDKEVAFLRQDGGASERGGTDSDSDALLMFMGGDTEKTGETPDEDSGGVRASEARARPEESQPERGARPPPSTLHSWGGGSEARAEPKESQSERGVHPLARGSRVRGSPQPTISQSQSRQLSRVSTPLQTLSNTTPNPAPNPPLNLFSYSREHPRSAQCQGKNKTKQPCNISLQWDRVGVNAQQAKRLIFARFCGFHAKKQDDEYPWIDLSVSPQDRPPKSPYYPDEIGLRIAAEERQAVKPQNLTHAFASDTKEARVGRAGANTHNTHASCRVVPPVAAITTPSNQNTEHDEEEDGKGDIEGSRCSHEVYFDCAIKAAVEPVRGERDKMSTPPHSSLDTYDGHGRPTPVGLPSVFAGTDEAKKEASSTVPAPPQSGPQPPTPTRHPPIMSLRDIAQLAQQLSTTCIRGEYGEVRRVSEGELVEDEFLTDVVRAIEGVYSSHATRINTPPGGPTTTNTTKTTHKDFTFVIDSEKKRDRKSTIVQDSGSSRDIACDPDVLYDVRSVTPVSLITGNGECQIAQEGTARVTRINGQGKPIMVSRPMLLDTRLPVNIASTGRMDHIHHRSIIHQNGQMVILKDPIRINEKDVLVRGRLMSTLLYRWDDEKDEPLDVNVRYVPPGRDGEADRG